MTDFAPVARPGQLARLEALTAIPEEEIWLASQKGRKAQLNGNVR